MAFAHKWRGGAIVLATAIIICAIEKPLQATAASFEARQTTISVPFSPPVGKTLRYRFTRTQTGGGNDRDTSVEMGVQFERLKDGGYRMQVTTTPLGIPAAAKKSEAVQVMETPIAFRLNPDGIITGFEDEDAYWRKIEQVARSFVESDSKTAPDQKILSTVFQQMRGAPPEQRLALLSKNVQPLLEFGSTELEIGKPVETQADVTLPFAALADRKIPRMTKVTAESADKATVSVTVRTKMDPAALTRAIEALAALGPKGKPPSIADIQIDQRSSYVVSRETGLTNQYTEIIESGAASEHLKRLTTLQYLAD